MSLHDELSKLGMRPQVSVSKSHEITGADSNMSDDVSPIGRRGDRDSDVMRQQQNARKPNAQDVPMSGYDKPIDFSSQLRGGAKPTAAFVGGGKPKNEAKKPTVDPKAKPRLSQQVSGDPFQPQPVGQKQAKQNYDKPWLKNAKGHEPEKPKDAAKTFLEHHYPDGVGPDADLINMLERDCLQKNPNVKFEDIAGLDETKKLL